MTHAGVAEAGRRALEALDRALSRRPERDEEAFAVATESLCRMRDQLDPGTERRDAVNAAISAVLAGTFPLGSTPWAEVTEAAAALRHLLSI